MVGRDAIFGFGRSLYGNPLFTASCSSTLTPLRRYLELQKNEEVSVTV